MQIVESINQYNKKYYPEKFTDDETLGHIFQDYLMEKQQLVARTIDKMKQFRQVESAS